MDAVVVRAVTEGREVVPSDVRGLGGDVTGGWVAADGLLVVEEPRVARRSDDVESVLEWAAGREAVLTPVVLVLELGRVDIRFDSPFMAFLVSSPDARPPRPSVSVAAPLEVMVVRRAVEILALGRVGGLARLLPDVARAVELAGPALCADEAVLAVMDDREAVLAANRFGAAEVAGVTFLVGRACLTAGGASASGLFGVSVCSIATSEESAAVGAGAASGSAMSISGRKGPNTCRSRRILKQITIKEKSIKTEQMARYD